MTLLLATDLVAGRNGRALTPPLGFALGAGEALIVTGANGAGKSTLLRTLAGLLPPLAGRCEGEGPHGYLGHRNGLKAARPVAAELGFFRRFAGGRDALPVAEALAAVGLPAIGEVPCGALSAGQARRAALARLLVGAHRLWILDEPTAALDGESQGRFAAIARAHLAAGGALVAATHQSLGLGPVRELRLEPPRPPEPADTDADAWDEVW